MHVGDLSTLIPDERTNLVGVLPEIATVLRAWIESEPP
jgi:hypothetical protein